MWYSSLTIKLTGPVWQETWYRSKILWMPLRGNGHWRQCPSLDYIVRNYWRINRMHQLCQSLIEGLPVHPQSDGIKEDLTRCWLYFPDPSEIAFQAKIIRCQFWQRRRGERCRCAQFRSREQIRLSWKNFGVFVTLDGDWPESIPSCVPFSLGWTLYNRCSPVWYTAIYTGP